MNHIIRSYWPPLSIFFQSEIYRPLKGLIAPGLEKQLNLNILTNTQIITRKFILVFSIFIFCSTFNIKTNSLGNDIVFKNLKVCYM